MVISVGNITVGGVGKTPLVIYLAQTIHNLGYQAAVISRGYGGSAQRAGGVVSDGSRLLMEADQAGDEPRMIAERLRHIPVVIGADRYQAGLQALELFKPEVILLDDAFQHRRLHRDLDLVLLDYQRPFGNRRMLPRGPLREPISALNRAQAFVFTRSDAAPTGDHDSALRLIGDRPRFNSSHAPVIRRIVNNSASDLDLAPEQLLEPGASGHAAASAVIFSGIADNRRFQESVRKLQFRVVGMHAFPDHHPYQADDLRQIAATVKKTGAKLLITTAKDYARIAGRCSWPTDLVVLDVDIVFPDPWGCRFNRFIKERLLKHHMRRL